MRRRLLACAPFSAASGVARTPHRCYYDKVRQEREGSDDGPAAIFRDFPKSPSPNHVPEELHTTSTEAVASAERLQRWFLLFSVVTMSAICFSGFLDPFGEGYRRPEGYGMHGAASALLPDRELVIMAKDTAKKNMRRNEARMRAFTICTWAVNALSLVFIMYHRGSLPWFRDLVGLGFWAGQEFVALFLLKAFAKPTYSSAGELLECPDASNPSELGVYSYAQDVLWVCWVVELLCYLLHWAFFVLYLPLPAMALYQGWCFIGPMLLRRQPATEESSEGTPMPRNRAERRRQELLQRKKNMR